MNISKAQVETIVNISDLARTFMNNYKEIMDSKKRGVTSSLAKEVANAVTIEEDKDPEYPHSLRLTASVLIIDERYLLEIRKEVKELLTLVDNNELSASYLNKLIELI